MKSNYMFHELLPKLITRTAAISLCLIREQICRKKYLEVLIFSEMEPLKNISILQVLLKLALL